MRIFTTVFVRYSFAGDVACKSPAGGDGVTVNHIHLLDKRHEARLSRHWCRLGYGFDNAPNIVNLPTTTRKQDESNRAGRK